MKVLERIRAAPTRNCPVCATALLSLGSYPREILDILIYHRLHFHMDPSLAAKSYRQLRSEFVDWNEVRISPIREIQEQVSKAENSLELSVFIKDLLEFVHHDKHQVELETLSDENLTDIRRYLKQVRNMEPASIDLILMLRKNHPVLPLTGPMDQMFLALGLVKDGESRDRKEKSLFELVSDGKAPVEDGGPAFDGALAFHHLALNHCRRETDLIDAPFKSAQCVLSQIGKEYGRKGRARGKKTKKSTTSRSRGGSTAKTRTAKTAGSKSSSAKARARKTKKKSRV